MRPALFYDHDDAMLDALAQFAGRHLELGHTVVVFLTSAHASQLRGNLAAAGFGGATLNQRRYVELDAAAMLPSIIDESGFDATKFSIRVADMIDSILRNGAGVAAFSEMSALSSASNCHEAAVQLDRAWCELGRRNGVELMRAYPLDASFAASDRAPSSFASRNNPGDPSEPAAWETLRRMNVALGGEFEEGRLLQTVLDAAVELVGATRGVLLRRDEGDGSQLWQLTETKAADAPAEALLPRAELWRATLLDHRVIRCDELEPHAASISGQRRWPARSYLAVPLTTRSCRVHGGLFLLHVDTGAFTQRDELLLEALAAQAAIAIDNAQLRRATDTARDEQRILNETLEQRIAERTAALNRSEQQLDQLISGIADHAIYLLDADGRVVTWNTGAERTMGYAAEDVIGSLFTLFHTAEDCAAGMPERALATARRTGKYEAEGWRVRADGKRFWATVLIDAIHDVDGAVVGFAKVTRDMTERRAIEEQLQQSQRMEAMGRMTGGVAHDFNNLLTIILGNLDTVCRERELKSKVRTAAEHALRGAQRAAALTRQLLAFARRQPLNPKPTDVNHLIAGTVELLKRTFGESITIVAELTADSVTCEVDAAQLENALINLAMNARDAMATGGRLTLSTTNTHREDPAAPSQAIHCVTITINDTGVGMSDHVREHAFEPFFTTKPAGRGTGLGLSQVYGFVRQSGGHIELRSETDHGTTIAIHLPCRDTEVQDAAEMPSVQLKAASGTVVVVEDNEDVRRYGAGMLRELGFFVLETADAEAALEVLDRREDVRLLFTDVHLPGMRGDSLARHALSRMPGLKVLLTTGYPQEDLSLDGDGSALLTKPYTRTQLAHAISELLDGATAAVARPRALLVEDDVLLRDFTARMLEQMQLDVEQVGSVAQALELVKDGRRFDFALVDRLLGDGDGNAVVAALHAAQPRMPVLLTSGYGDPDTSDDDALADTLRKPYGYDALADALARLGLRSKQLRPGRP